MLRFKNCVPDGFEPNYLPGYGDVYQKCYRKYSILITSSKCYHATGYRIVLIQHHGKDEYYEVACLPPTGEKELKIVSEMRIRQSIAELLDLNGFNYWIKDVLY